jgi:hypothetical protein
MLRQFLTACWFVAAGVLAFAGGAAAEPQYSRASGALPVSHNDYDRVCCKRGNHDWWSTSRECRRVGGYVTYNRECRHDGHWEQGNNRGNNRVCCQRPYRGGYQDWWSTERECARAGGYQTYNKVCRRHKSDPPFNGGYGHGPGYGQPYPQGNEHGRVCCYRDGYVWWSTRYECRRAYGQETYNKTCRRAY